MLVILIASALVFNLIFTLLTVCPLTQNSPARIAYSSHAPIFINDNADFFGSNSSTGISWGSGTSDDPFIIEGWGINSTGFLVGMIIGNTTAYFIVRDCFVHDATQLDMLVDNVTNGSFLRDKCTSTQDGYGIYIRNSNHCLIENVNSSANAYDGLFLFNSNYNAIRNSTFSDSSLGNGIYLYDSTSNDLRNNSCLRNQNYGIVLGTSCTNLIINNTCSSNYYGIVLGYTSLGPSESDIVINNTCSDNYFGIFLYSSSGNTLNNNFCSNNGYGMKLDSSSNSNTLNNNTCINNTHIGIEIDYSTTNAVSNNTCLNNEHGIYLYSMVHSVLSNNTCSNNSISGIYLEASSNYNTIINNNCSNDYQGIFVGTFICYNSFLFNTFSFDGFGLYFDQYSNLVTANNNTFIDNSYGIYLFVSNSITMRNNSCINNSYGIFLSTSDANVISNNYCLNNTAGVYLSNSYSNTIFNNTFLDNQHGIHISSGYYNTIWNNTFIGNNGAISRVYNPAHNQALDNGADNSWNSIGSPHGYGNIWGDLVGPDLDRNGIVDGPYYIDGIAISKDNYPIAIWDLMRPMIENSPPTSVNLFSNYSFYAFASTSDNGSSIWNFKTNAPWLSLIWSNETDCFVSGSSLIHGSFWANLSISDFNSSDYINWTINVQIPPITSISINSNSEFVSLATSYGWPGDGTHGNPYVIRDIDIDATGHPFAINIGNTNLFFIVSNCSIHGAFTSGIFFTNMTNGRIDGNTISSSLDGIILQSSSRCIIVDNNVFGCTGYSISLSSSSGNVIYHNNFNSSVGSYSQAYDDTGSNIWNTSSEGNYWSDWTAPDFVAPFGIVDNPYNIDGGSGTKDYYPSTYIPHGDGIRIPHAPILINGNGDFTNANGVIRGSGTFADPYIIEGWNISASGTTGIVIGNTSAYFIVRRCYVHDGGDFHSGIFLINCMNGKVDNNSCVNNYCGITLLSSSYNTISYNNCTSNPGFGIFLASSSDSNLVWHNNCSWNNYSGIALYLSCDGNVIDNNTCTFSTSLDGIDLGEQSDNNLITRNNCSSNYLLGISLFYSSNNNVIFWNTFRDNSIGGVAIISANDTGNRVFGNIFINNNGAEIFYDSSHAQAYDNGTNNWWNSSAGYGNYWYDWTTPDNVAPFGIVDMSYEIPGAAFSTDCYPMTVPPGSPDIYPPLTISSLSGTLGTNGWHRSSVGLNLSASDWCSGLNATYYRLGTTGNWTFYSSVALLSKEGNTTVQFYSRDNAGNIETIESITIRIDTESPISSANVSGSTITLSAVDNTSGVFEIYYRIDGGTWMNYSEPISITEGGDHSLDYYSLDNAGNSEGIKSIDISNSGIMGVDFLGWVLIIAAAIAAVFCLLVALAMRKSRHAHQALIQPLPVESTPQQPPQAPSPVATTQPPISQPQMLIAVVLCKSCGAQNKAAWLFCGSCGAKLR